MNRTQAKKEIADLIEQIDWHNQQYYLHHQPTISDEEYDLLLKRLIALEEEFPQLKSLSSPTQRIGVKIQGDLPAVIHLVKMQSLDNSYSLEEIKEWYARVVKGLDGFEPSLVVELKIDGVSCALTYKDGHLVLAATRGDGITGEDVTHNAKMIQSIPLNLKGSVPSLLEVRGEVYLDKEDFYLLNQRRKIDGEDLFANPRNAAAGSLKLLDARLSASRKLKFFVHSFGVLEGGKDIVTQWDFLDQAKDYGFVVNPLSRFCATLQEALDFCEAYEGKRESLGYDVDGVVIKVDEIKQQNQLGSTLKSPRWAVAFKFPAYQATTTIKDIIVQVGRTGVLTPVAELEPVACGGVVISRATLHNFDEIKRLGVNVQDRVLLERAGDVIPKIVKVVEKKSKDFFAVPKHCPSCAGQIKKENAEEVAYVCVNPSCPKQLERLLVHYASRTAMDIEGLGEAVIAQLLAQGLVKNLADIYDLKKEELLNLEFFAEKKAENLLKAIEVSKSKPLSRFLFGLGIGNIGIKAAVNLARQFGSLDAIIKATADDLQKVADIGPVMAKSVVEYFNQEYVQSILYRLRKTKLNLLEPKLEQTDRLRGKKFVFTGELDGLTRSRAGLLVEQQGGLVLSAISRNVDYLVAGVNAGSKQVQAEKLDVKILNQKEFEEMLHD